ncbi:AraC family transcriptional regulator [Erythrobacter sp. JK5]|uniref:helix-turn-helix domain-containing protein n=1 Tax=Erythrobacter sp. JK5 TaxID=2829500 RepID=UPI001BA77ACE|nr:helix-turn-helix domain-containing protein [Erythrobacter sp. JK5]QUL37466.1 AraC family transcriptional regulator [Erythrobacter sp. JK5]
MNAAVDGPAVTIRFALPEERLRPFITTYYRTEVRCSPGEPWLEDRLHPEWPNLRFLPAGSTEGSIGSALLEPMPAFAVTGPTSRACRFRVASGGSWGIGLMPLGWAAFMGGEAGDYADRVVDGLSDPAFARFHSLARALATGAGGFADGLKSIETHMAGLADAAATGTLRNAAAITAVNAALVDPETATVADLAQRVDMNVRSLERLCRRAFGFTPKLLLRRQRFLRSLAQFMLDPSLKWLSTLDHRYHDQAHFVRDFKRFMGMAPTTYAKLDKPLLVAAARARMEIAGEAVQGLHEPKPAD